MIVITGATGALNGATVDHLLDRGVPAHDIAVVARDTAKAARFAARGVEVRHGDYTRPDTLPDAFRGADQLLLVSTNDPRADAVALHGAAIDAAVVAGAGRILYTSHHGADLRSVSSSWVAHARTEQLLAASGTPWTALRNGFYTQSLAWLLGPWRTTGVITVPADGPVAWTTRDDAAEAAAVILTAARPFDGPVALTATAAPTFRDIATIASDIVGHTIGYHLADEDEWVASRIAQGFDDFTARLPLGGFHAIAQGSCAHPDPTLKTLLEREPRTVGHSLATEHADTATAAAWETRR